MSTNPQASAWQTAPRIWIAQLIRRYPLAAYFALACLVVCQSGIEG